MIDSYRLMPTNSYVKLVKQDTNGSIMNASKLIPKKTVLILKLRLILSMNARYADLKKTDDLYPFTKMESTDAWITIILKSTNLFIID